MKLRHPHNMPLNLIVTVTIAEPDIQDFLIAMEADCLGSRQEPGCQAFDVLRSETPPADNITTFYFYESYNDQASLDFHKTTPHFSKWTEFKEAGRVQSITVERTVSLF